MRTITRPQYDWLVIAPDEWELIPNVPNYARGPVKRLFDAGLAEIKVSVVPPSSRLAHYYWRITPAGLEMIERCKRVWQLQLALPLEPNDGG